MIPILFPDGETTFLTQGLGALTDALSCRVTEETVGAGGVYELELTYPVTGVHYKEIQDRCIIWAIPSPYREPQPFRIYRSSKPLSGKVTFYARHLSYDLSGVPVAPCGAGSVAAALVALETNAAVDSPFTFWTDKSTEADFSVTIPSSTRSVLAGQAGSILDVYGGEFEFDRFVVKLYNERGRNNGVTVRYGKNLTDLVQDRNSGDLVTGIYPYWTDIDGGNLVICDPPIVQAPGTYSFARVRPVDFSSDFEEVPTPEQLQARAEAYVAANKVGVPKVNLTVSFVALDQTDEYADIRLLEKVDLYDTVTIQYSDLGVEAEAKVIKITTDVLAERYTQITLGDARGSLSDTIASQGQQIQQKPSKSDLQQTVDKSTDLITGGKGGHVVIRLDGEGKPFEILILDTDDITTAQNVWRWNSGGFGHSSTGYNGPYATAITQDGKIVADFITAGTLNANILEGGVIRSKDGKNLWNLDTGEVHFESMASQSDLDDLKNQVDQGVDHVTTSTGFTFNQYGITVSKTGSEMSTQVTEDGMTISRSGTQVLLVNNRGVEAYNLHAKTYFILSGKARMESWGEYVACFWIGGQNNGSAN